MKSSTSPFRITVEEATAQLSEGEKFRVATLLERGTLLVAMYAPRGHDPQTAHDQDEVYVVVSGSGEFVNGDDRHPFGPGDVIFVPAGREHRFEDFTDDFSTWVIFYGPHGGERTEES